MDSENQSEDFAGAGVWAVWLPSGGYYRGNVLHGALGVV